MVPLLGKARSRAVFFSLTVLWTPSPTPLLAAAPPRHLLEGAILPTLEECPIEGTLHAGLGAVPFSLIVVGSPSPPFPPPASPLPPLRPAFSRRRYSRLLEEKGLLCGPSETERGGEGLSESSIFAHRVRLPSEPSIFLGLSCLNRAFYNLYLT